MDPITRAARGLLQSIEKGLARGPALRLHSAAGQRKTLIQSLHLGEWQADNHWPLCLVEAGFGGAQEYAAALARRIREDFAALREGLAEDGVALAEAPAGAETTVAGCRALAGRLGGALAQTGAVAGLCVALVPAQAPDDAAWPEFVAALVAAAPAGVRWLVWDPAPEPLAEVLPPRAVLELDEDEAWKYIQAQSRKNMPPGTGDDPRTHLLAAAEAARASDLRGALAAYGRAAAAYERAGAASEAATVRVAMGSLTAGTGDVPGGLAHFDRAAQQAGQAGAWGVACQAQLGAAAVLLQREDLPGAERRYAAAAELAHRAESPPLRVEALRMAGTCALERGDAQAATGHWRAAVDAGAALPAAERGATTLAQVGAELVALLERRGMAAQASAVRGLLARP